MEKVYIKPSTHEIIIKGAVADGHMDIFSYDPTDEETRKLGHLYVLGHVQHETDDMAYAINLISALAKREYYARLTIAPKEAFAATLKKVNEVVEEFFEHKGIKIDIGVFAIAGEQMYISKLGKFKVLLARDEKTIDVLNHISFDKETVQEKQFSSVISGQVQPNDRILAYYPSRATAARERYIKMYLHKYEGPQFAEQLKTIKKEKDGFSCAMVYVQLDKVKEVAKAPTIQPQELAPQLTTTAMPSGPKKAKAERKMEQPKPALASQTDATVAAPEPKPEPVAPVAEVPPVKEINSAPKRYVETNQEIPRIIPTEFSLGKKENPISTVLGRIRFNHFNSKQKAAMSLLMVVLIVGVSFGVRALVGINPEARALNDTLRTAQERLELAKTKISQSNSAEARGIVTASLASLEGSPSEKTSSIKTELEQLLDEIDQAKDAPTSIVAQVVDQGPISLLAVGKEIYAYTSMDTSVGKLVALKGDSIQFTREATNTQAVALVTSSKGTPALIDTANQKSVALKENGPEVATFTLPQPVVATYFYADNLYVTDGTGIFKASDIFQGEAKAKTWLKGGAVLPADVTHMVVDGEIFTLTKDGLLTTYFQGEKKSEVATSLQVTTEDLLMTTPEGPSLYLLSKKSGRIHIIDKKTGTLLTTYKVGTQNPVVTATVDTEGTIYFVTQDNKIWKITE